MTTTAPHATVVSRTTASTRLTADRGPVRRPTRHVTAPAIVATVLGTVLALLVLLQMLPQTGTDAAALASERVALVTIPLFLAGAMGALACVALILVRAARRAKSEAR